MSNEKTENASGQTFFYESNLQFVEDRSAPIDGFMIERIVDSWAIWRDARQWERIEELWHPEGKLVTTWGGLATQAEFAHAAQTGFEKGDRMLHENGGCTVDIVQNRAISQTKLRIMQRTRVQGVLCDVVCIGRDYDFLEFKDGKWGFLLRQPIYERDWISPVNPAEIVSIPEEALKDFPLGYGHLGYIQAELGYQINKNLPTHENSRLKELYEAGDRWLKEAKIDWSI